MEIITYRSGRIVCTIGSIGFLLGLLGCTVQLAETQSPSTGLPVTVETVEAIPIQNRRAGSTSSSTGSFCERRGTLMRCTEVSRDELRKRFDELQSLDRY